MAQLKLQTLLLVLLMALASASPLAQHNESETSLDKRWFSVPFDGQAPPDHSFAWPSNSRGRRAVRYCFKDGITYRDLSNAFFGGVSKWIRAMASSSLAFDTDPACGKVQAGRCLCNFPGVAVDTLHISISPIATASRGYTKASQQHSHDSPPNVLRFYPRLTRSLNPRVDDAEDKMRALLMGHEIGHVIGLEHENQRPDAFNWIFFDCPALGGYDLASVRVNQVNNEPKFHPGMSIHQKMDLVCNDLELASKYFHQATKYIPFAHSVAATWRLSNAFDYNSIMIYGSMPGHSVVMQQAFRYPVLKYDHRDPRIPMERIFRGGSLVAEDAGISNLDIERVMQLYPIVPGMGVPNPLNPRQQGQSGVRSNATAGAESKQTPYRVVVSDLVTTTIRPAPTDFPVSLNDSKANELADEYAKACRDNKACSEPEETWLGDHQRS